MGTGQRFTGHTAGPAITVRASTAAVRRPMASGLVLSARRVKRGVLLAGVPRCAIAPGACHSRGRCAHMCALGGMHVVSRGGTDVGVEATSTVSHRAKGIGWMR